VGLLHTIHALKGNMPTKKQLALEAIHIERNILKEEGGIQDQIHAAIGGFNKIIINKEGEFQVIPITISKEKSQLLQSHLMFYFTGFSRDAHEISKSQVKNIPQKRRELTLMQQMVDEAVSVLNGHGSIIEFGKLLHEAWTLKRGLSEKISTSKIDEIYEASREAGAIGGKLLGAGGGGFILLFVKPEDQASVKEKFNKLLQVPFRFETQGSQIVVYEPDFTPNYLTQK
jgi:D-glycero-alpha-D-manno-heptose-7-phosphate kinase